MPRAHRLREGETTIGRAPTCELVISSPLMSRQHARVRVKNGRVFLQDAGSTYGTIFRDQPLAGEIELRAGDVFSVGQVVVTLDSDVAESEVLSDAHHLIEGSSTVLRKVDPPLPATRPVTSSTSGTASLTVSAAVVSSTPSPPTSGERRVYEDRRQVDLGRAAGERRSGRDRRGGRMLRLLGEIGRTLVTVQSAEQVLARVVDLVFDVLPAERAF